MGDVPTAWGGWGYRVSRRGRAVVVRGGPGLVLTRRSTVPFMVTVDGADQAADVVNALVRRGDRAEPDAFG